ncbi:uroporphyrinogen decarboxylase [Riemerella columbipharyngis]|uniref:Inner membrane protein n=1 Tax=Riemerella columbipharyngis TaxID=1071918 RepID=A0A1G7DGV8_9FLAO|nr:uroporphyrinogen decarboxylase [Riemerella columbipharyngis]SDE50818.1 hypothetical protein SAMN05421544_11121 [Riemerella columbipharyngis]
MSPTIIQYIGYAASVFIVLSFVLKNIKHIRIVNLIGCICFVIYGAMNDTVLWPIIIPNALLSFIQVYYLIKLSKNG